MSPVDAALVRRKLGVISRNVLDLESVQSIGLDEYRADRFRQKGTERLLQETIEAAVDANLHLLRFHGAEAPADYYQSFTALGRAGVIPLQLANELAPASGLRNRLVHEYDVIDDEIVLDSVRMAVAMFPRYVAAVERFLTQLGV